MSAFISECWGHGWFWFSPSCLFVLYKISIICVYCLDNWGRGESPCYFWKKQSLGGHHDLALFGLRTSGRISSDFGPGHFEHMSANPAKVYSETIQGKCSLSGHLMTLRPFVLARGQCFHPPTDGYEVRWLSRDPVPGTVLSVTCVVLRCLSQPKEWYMAGRQTGKQI